MMLVCAHPAIVNLLRAIKQKGNGTMKFTRWMLLFFLLGLTLSFSLFSACSDDESGSPSPTPTPTFTPTATPTVNTPPETVITGGPDVASSFPIVFTFAGSDAEDPESLLTFATRLDAGEWSAWSQSTSASYSGIADGEHIFEVKARDSGGLEDPTPASKVFSVHLSTDTEAPETWITSGPSGISHASDALFVFSGSDNETATENLVYSFKFDAGSWSGFASDTQVYFDNLSDGDHTIQVVARDEAGNVDPTPDSRTFTVMVNYYSINLTPPSATQYVNAGVEAIFRVDIVNNGGLPAHFTFQLASQVPEEWTTAFCLSSGVCIIDTVTIEFSPGQSDYMTVHLYTDSGSSAGTQGTATLSARCDEDSSVYGESLARAIIQ
jgi:hypothetical protein